MRWFFFGIWVVFLILMFYLRAKGATNHSEALPYTTINPHTYQLGTVQEMTLVAPQKGKVWTEITWKPAMTSLLYDERLLFCGNVTEKFAGIRTNQEIVLVYSRSVPEVSRIEGPLPGTIGCHSLDGIRFVQKMDLEEK